MQQSYLTPEQEEGAREGDGIEIGLANKMVDLGVSNQDIWFYSTRYAKQHLKKRNYCSVSILSEITVNTLKITAKPYSVKLLDYFWT